MGKNGTYGSFTMPDILPINSNRTGFTVIRNIIFAPIISIFILSLYLSSFHICIAGGQANTSYKTSVPYKFPPLSKINTMPAATRDRIALPEMPERPRNKETVRVRQISEKSAKNNSPGRLALGITNSNITVPGDFSTIQAAVDAAVDGDTISVSPGTYKETIEIKNKNLTLQGENRDTTIINGENLDKLSAIYVSGGNVNINGFTIENAGWSGIDIFDSKASTLEKNLIKGNSQYGIVFSNSTVTITNNIINSNNYGVASTKSTIDIRDNVIKENECGFVLYTSTGAITNNTIVNNKDCGVTLVESTIDIRDNAVEENAYGLNLFNSTGTITNNTIISNNYGIALTESTNVMCTNNHVIKNMLRGMFITICKNIEITGNEITDTTHSSSNGVGIDILDSSALISDNTIKQNTRGIGIYNAESIVEVKGNSITDNIWQGIYCDGNPMILGCCNILSNNGMSSDECASSLEECPCPDESDSTMSITSSLALLTRLGATAQLTAIIENKSGATLNIIDEATWTSSDKKIATVDEKGLVTAIGNGTVDVCADYKGLQACIEIKVNTVHNGINQWTISNEGAVLGIINDIAIDPANPDIIYAGTNNGSIFKSKDNGETWQEKAEGLGGIIALVIDPSNPDILYAGAYGILYKSIDAGENWNSIYEQVINALAINPVDTKTIYAGSRGAGMLKSTDGGNSFVAINTGLNFTTVRQDSLVINLKNPKILFIVVEDENGTSGGILYKSSNEGNSWNASNNGLPTAYVRGIAIHPTNPTTLFAGTYLEGVYKTTDGGENWFILERSPHENNMVINIDTKDPDILYVGNYGQGVFESRDGGTSWKELLTQLTNRSISSLAINPEHPTLFAGTNKGVFRYKHAFTKIKASPNADGVSIDIEYEFNKNTGIDPIGFNIYRSTSEDGDFEKINVGLLGTETTHFNDRDFLDGVTHVYKMTVEDKDGETLKSFSASARPLKDSNPDFDMKITEPEKSVVQGESISFPITLTSQDNFGEEVFLKVSGLPEGTTGKFTPTSGVPPLAVTLNVSTGAATPAGNYEITMTARSNNKADTATVKLGVTEEDSDESSVTQEFNTTDVKVGDKIEVNGEITPAQSEGEITTTFVSPSGVTSSKSAVTDTDGKYSLIKLLDKVGAWTVTTSWKGTDEIKGATTPAQGLYVSQAVTTISMTTDATTETVTGDKLTLKGNVSPTPGEGKLFLEIDNIDGSIYFNGQISISEKGEFTQEFKVTGGEGDESGEIKIYARFDGTEDYGGSEKKITVPIQKPLGMAIIVAGGGDGSENPPWKATNNVCNYVYTVLKNQGIPDDGTRENQNRIYYLHPDADNDADRDGTADTDATPTVANLKKAIEEWALGLVGTSSDSLKVTPLTIYMMGPGEIDKCEINSTETITAVKLKGWLNQLFTSVKEKFQVDKFPVNVILESPQSGSFIDDLIVEDGVGSGRTVVTSTDSCASGESSCNGGDINITGDGSVSFSKQFFFSIKGGKSVTTAWAEANLIMQELFDDQNPQLDADGDGVTNEEKDESLGEQVFLNQGMIPVEEESAAGKKGRFKTGNNAVDEKNDAQSFVINQRPVVQGVQKDFVVRKETETLWAIVEDPDNDKENLKVHGLLFPPKSDTAKVLELEYSEEKGRYETSASGFTSFGIYKVLFVASDKQGNTSYVRKTLANSQKGGQNVVPAILKGYVYNENTGKKIKVAKLELQGVRGSTKTSKNGAYLLQLPSGVYTVTVTKTGFNKEVIKDIDVSCKDSECVVTKNIGLTSVSSPTAK